MNNEPQQEPPNIPGPYISPQQTESSPLKQTLLSETRRNWLQFLCHWETPEQPGSLKTIVVILFGSTAVITLALLTQVYYGEYQVEPHGSVASDSEECSVIGTDVLKNGGNAIDAAIACMICLGVVNFHVTGLGGGGYMMVYNHRKHVMLDVIDFRETVPESYGSEDLDTGVEGLMVGVPGMLLGLFNAHAKNGKLPWADLLMPSVNLARKGFAASESLLKAKTYLHPNSQHNIKLMQLLNSLKPDENVTMLALAATLELIASKGPQVFYNGSLAGEIAYSVKVANGSMTADDVSKYTVSRSELLQTRFGGFDVLVPKSSCGGALLVNSLTSIEALNFDQDASDTILKMSDVLHEAYVSFLHNYDAVEQPPRPAASNVAVMDKDETYVTLVAGLNTILGSQILTDAGFILNNAIANGGINSERRPVSMATPVVALQNGDICGRRLLLGSGDATVAAQVLTVLAFFNQNASYSVEHPRFMVDTRFRHITLEDSHEPRFAESDLMKLSNMIMIDHTDKGPYISVNVIEKKLDLMTPVADTRGGGVALAF